MKIPIKDMDNIIFDLGGVILDLDFEAAINAFIRLGINSQLFEDKLYFSDPVFHKFQLGKVTASQFREHIRGLASNPNLSNDDIDKAWCAMLAGIPIRRIEKIMNLRQDKKAYLFSNTNEIHINHLENLFFAEFGFPFSSVFDGIAYSYKILEAKPSESSFRSVLGKFGIIAGNTLFIDDIEENILGAQKAGLSTFWLSPGLDIADLF